MVKRKIPWLAAALNLLIPGAGYIYVGTRLRFGVLLVAAATIVLFAPVSQEAETADVDLEVLTTDPTLITMLVAAVFIAIAFAYDGWCDAKAHNESAAIDVSSDESDS